MKRLIFGCLVAVGCGSIPMFADYCCPTQYDCNTCCDDDDFCLEGWYIGGNIGAHTHTAYRNDLDGFLTDTGGWTTNDTNVTLGVQLGYDWQCCHTLLGLVADWNWVNNDRSLPISPNTPSIDRRVENEFDWFTTIRARAGVTLCDTIFYVTAGAAVSRIETTWRDGADVFSHNRTRWGWTGGAGTEFTLWCNFSLGAEVLFLNFDNYSRSATTAAGTGVRFSNADTAWVGRLFLNYRFGDLCSCFW